VEEYLRVPFSRRVRPPRQWGGRGTAGDPAARWLRRIEHRGRAHRGDQARSRPGAPPGPAPGADPHRLRRRHPRLPELAGQPEPPYDQEGQPEGPWNPARPARQPGTQARPGAENGRPPQPQPHRSRSRNIKA